ncbi:cyclic nucleotide-binding domain-containing protein [Hyphomicrobium sp.]|uniref:Crp/Fnr family transcriptional regulator n=1 Tax=Hyphomicrobium sp. TaxID=82 RepID=UPI0025C14F0E|nr:cyclic nucleotide-binding domain-containing protein [Hyphomicrobium sp.]MCC7253558.1 cyclic nucleotide-binding domain-containing protein [Hyphomicrobium sp.]
MAIDALVLPLLNVPLFQGLKPLQLTEIARRADRIVYKPGDVIVTAHGEPDAAVLVVSGEAVRTEGPGLERGANEAIPTGALISEMTMLIETECTSTVVARTPVRALRITRSEMIAHMTDDPSLADHFIEKISGRLSSFVEGLREIDKSLVTIGPPVNGAEAKTTASAAGGGGTATATVH